jgi:integrase
MTTIKKLEKISLRCDRKNYLILTFSHNGNLYQKNIGKDEKENRKFAIAIMARINSDLIWEKFENLEKYFSRKSQDAGEKTFLFMWYEFLDHRKKSGLKQKTLEYDQTLSLHIKKLKSLESFNENKIFLELKSLTTEEMTRRILIALGQCLKFHKKNNYQDFYNQSQKIKPSIKKNKDKNKPIALSDSEIIFLNEKILESEDHRGKFYIFNFWLNTGCRPSSALAVRKKDIDLKNKKIIFIGSYQLGEFSKGSKNGNIYSIPMSEVLEKILLDYFLKNNFSDDNLIFPFSKKLDSYRKFFKFLSRLLEKNFTAYNCRDTFITRQILNGIPIGIIAKWCDNSVSEIEKKYFDVTQINIIPK